eukprot:scaffold6168_cov420-Prasinococcus_capsulatus_cf.AAC.3
MDECEQPEHTIALRNASHLGLTPRATSTAALRRRKPFQSKWGVTYPYAFPKTASKSLTATPKGPLRAPPAPRRPPRAPPPIASRGGPTSGDRARPAPPGSGHSAGPSLPPSIPPGTRCARAALW